MAGVMIGGGGGLTYEHWALWGMHAALKSETLKTASALATEAAATARMAAENCILMVGGLGSLVGRVGGGVVELLCEEV